MIAQLKSAFSNIDANECFKIVSNEKFEIYDCKEDDEDCSTGRCYIRVDGDFKVINPSKKNIGFLAIDKCIFFDDDKIKKCDCIVMDNDTLCFIRDKRL